MHGQERNRRFRIPRWVARILEGAGRAAVVADPVQSAFDRIATDGEGSRRDVHLGRLDGGAPTDSEIARGRLAPRHRRPPVRLAVAVGCIGLGLVCAWPFLSSPLCVVLFWIGLSLTLVAVVTPLSMRSDAVLTDSTRQAEHIARIGQPAVATVTGIQMRNERINADQHGTGGDEVCDLDLIISPQGATSSYPVRKRLAVDRHQMHWLRVGASFEVRIDPSNPSVVVLP